MSYITDPDALLAAHAVLWVDLCDIERHVQAKQPNGTTTQTRELIASDVPCRWSQPAKPDKDQGLPEPCVEVSATLFCGIDVDVRAGDVITARRGDFARTYDAGDPHRYSVHQEVPLHRYGVV